MILAIASPNAVETLLPDSCKHWATMCAPKGKL
jgi:hypothetical protein